MVARTLWRFGFEMVGGDEGSAEVGRPGVFRMGDQVGAVHEGPVLRFWEER